ncbi:beta family protein [Paenibacillus popilliae]|uniref:Beta protein n=1 Tax=Paenibacillus popilliae ATCC 14706 TaxID=1212764 RepID=M9LDC5_PAEPP|nr:beta family protein [Paenibacillus popilliae]GAC44337.1 hypothetical protein PPOP_3741 [Paenibacillus popilliae ATCC 14706]
MFEKKHYVPVLKWKQGEQKALECLSKNIRERLTPLIEIPPIDWDFENELPKKSIDEHLSNFGDTLQRSWQQSHPVFVDLIYLDSSDRLANNIHPMEFILKQARDKGIGIIPVTGSDRDSAYQSEVVSANKIDRLGACIRIQEHDFDALQQNIDKLLVTLQMNPSVIDLVIDYGYVNPTEKIRTGIFLTGLINSLPYLSEWRNVILCGTSFPKNLSDVSADSVEQLDRTEWTIWNSIAQKGSITRTPIFSDYGISNPEPFEGDPRFIKMSANIRYTANNKFIIFKGKVTRKFGGAQYHQIASNVVAHPEYSGSTFSNGDNYIYDVANNKDGPGNATNWRKAGTNHHITYVATELSNLTLP